MAEEQSAQNTLVEGEIPTEIVEEYISISDGQVRFRVCASEPTNFVLKNANAHAVLWMQLILYKATIY